MRAENKVTIEDIRARIYQRMQYDNKKDYFDILWSGWRQTGIRNHIHSAAFYTCALARGWLSINDANDLCCYAVKDWRPYTK